MLKKHSFDSFGWKVAGSLQQWVLEKMREVVLEVKTELFHKTSSTT